MSQQESSSAYNGALIPAYPTVLRAGLPVVVERDGFGAGGRFKFVAFWCGQSDGDVYVCDASERGYTKLWDADIVLLDLRDPAVRDAVVRAIWRKLRPEESELLTAPAWRYPWVVWGWHPSTPGPRPRWTLGEIGFDARSLEVQHPDDRAQHVIPTLASVPLGSPDRDLLALAEVAKAVLS
jgi:hypothetical protein